ncbi:hypothetical protein H7X68_02935 [Candidatus Saccharibacteria bacterium]|nr:hypothetical protein [Candidatus Saccharibacteria bacterium]
MNEQHPESRPVLVPRSGEAATRRVEVWSLTDYADEKGRRIVESQKREVIGDKFDFVAKGMSEKMLSPEGQAELAEELAASIRVGRQALETTVQTGSDQGVEKLKNSHLEALFSPIIRPELPQGDEDNEYDYLFGSDEDVAEKLKLKQAESQKNAPILEAQKEYDRFIDKDTRRIASGRLEMAVSRDQGLKELLHQFGQDKTSVEAVDAIREDKELRYSVGVYLLEKLNRAVKDDPDSFGDRLVRNGDKKNDSKSHMSVPSMTSREYATYIALAKIDGSFNGDRETADDYVQYDSNGKVINAQHRDAANAIL